MRYKVNVPPEYIDGYKDLYNKYFLLNNPVFILKIYTPADMPYELKSGGSKRHRSVVIGKNEYSGIVWVPLDWLSPYFSKTPIRLIKNIRG